MLASDIPNDDSKAAISEDANCTVDLWFVSSLSIYY